MTSPRPLSDDDAARPFPWRLALVLYPFAVMAVTINLFMLGLVGTWLGWPNIPPYTALIAALIVALPVNYLAARWVQSLLDRAEGR